MQLTKIEAFLSGRLFMKQDLYIISVRTFEDRDVLQVFSTHTNASTYLKNMNVGANNNDNDKYRIEKVSLKDDSPIVNGTVYVGSYTTSNDLGQYVGIFAKSDEAHNYMKTYYKDSSPEVWHKKIDPTNTPEPNAIS